MSKQVLLVSRYGKIGSVRLTEARDVVRCGQAYWRCRGLLQLLVPISKTIYTTASITAHESELNAQYPSSPAAARAHQKVKAWLTVGDNHNPLPK